MKAMHYILQVATDCSYHPIEDRFYKNNWQPELEDDKEYLQEIINSDPERFEGCIIKTIEI